MFNITFQQIAMFLEVAKRLNISAVAEELYISQAAMSKMIRRLEDSLGVKLFYRSNRGLTLTLEGEFLYNRLHRPYESINNALMEVQNLNAETKHTLKIGFPSTIDINKDYEKLKSFIAEYEAAHPNIEFVEILYDFIDLVHAVEYGEVDIAFLHSFVLPDMVDISSKPVVNCRTFLALSEKHPLAVNDYFVPEMMNDQVLYTIRTFDNESDLNITKDLVGSSITPRSIQYVPNLTTLLRMLKTKQGISLCGFFLGTSQDGVKFLPMKEQTITHTLNVAWRTDEVSRIARDFINAFPDDPAQLTQFFNFNS